MKTQTTRASILDNPQVITRAILYARVSKDDGRNDGRNLKGQIEMGREYATSKGYNVVAELSEDSRGASGAEIDLPQLSHVREMAAAGQFDVLIVREIDRLSRNLVKQLIVEEELKRAGVRIEYVLAEYEDSPNGRLNKNFRAMIAEYEKEIISERMTRARKLKVKVGSVIVAGRPPYGYNLKRDDKKMWLEINEEQAKIIRLVYAWYLEGASLWEIVRRLEEIHVPPPKKSGKGWHKTTVSNILNSQTYMGVWHYGKAAKPDRKTMIHHPKEQWIAVEVPPIVDRETWEKVQTQRDVHREKSKRNLKNEYLVSKLCTCGECGGRVFGQSANWPTGYATYYKCQSRREKKLKTCDLPIIKAPKLDTAVWEWVKSYFNDPKTLEDKLRAYQAEQGEKNEPLLERLDVIKGLITKNNKDLDSALEDLREVENRGANRAKARILDDIARMEKTLDDLEAQQARVIAQIEAKILTDEQINTLLEFGERLRRGLIKGDSDFNKRRQLVEVLNMKIVLSVDGGKVFAHISCILEDNITLCIEDNTIGGQW